jgi:hypothetical protein
MWARIDARCHELKCGRSQYFHMLVDWELRVQRDIHAHKSDGKWHFYPESANNAQGVAAFRAAEPEPGLGRSRSPAPAARRKDQR